MTQKARYISKNLVNINPKEDVRPKKILRMTNLISQCAFLMHYSLGQGKKGGAVVR